MARQKKPPTFADELTNEKKEEFLQLIRTGVRRGKATDIIFGEEDPTSPVAGARRRAMREYIMEHDDFEAAVRDAEIEALEDVDEAIFQAAISGSIPAAKAYWERMGVIERVPQGRPAGKQDADSGGGDAPPSGEDPDDLYNVVPIDPRTRRRQGE